MLAGLFIVVMGFYPYLMLSNRMDDKLTREENISRLREWFKFYVFVNDKIEVVITLFAAAALSVLMGILIFRFCADKRTVNVYYSLGITRNSLFYSRFFAGQLCLSLAVIPGTLISYFVNVAYLGLSWQLSLVLFYFYCGLTLFCLICFTVTAAVFASVGTVYEGALFSVGVLGAPTVFEFAAGQILDFFHKHIGGNVGILTFDGNYIFGSDLDFITGLSAYNPVLFMFTPLYNYSVGSLNEEKNVFLNNDAEWVFPDVTKVFIWLIVGIAVALVGGLVFFKRRNAENCGFLNTNKVLSNLVLFELLTAVGAFFFAQAKYYSEYAPILISGAIVAFVVYIIYEILLKRNFLSIVKTLYKLPAHAAVFALVCAVFAFDLTGTDSFVPNSADVEKAAITSLVNISWVSAKASTDAYMGESLLDTTSFLFQEYELPEFTSADDIEKITSLHREALEKEKSDGDMSETGFSVRYIMKDGREVIRHLKVTDRELCGRLNSLFDSETVKKARTDIILSSAPADADAETLFKSRNLQFTYDFASVTAIAPSFTEGNELKLTEDEFNALKKAVADDLNSVTSDDYINGASRQLGVLRFTADGVPLSGDIAYENEFFEPYMTQPFEETTQPQVPEEAFEEDAEGNETQAPSNEKMRKVKKLFVRYASYDYNTQFGEFSYDVLITPEMTKTLSFLKSIGCESCFEQTKRIKSVSFEKIGMYDPGYIADYVRIYEFYGGSVDQEYYYIPDMENLVGQYSENVITDEQRINELVPLMRIHSYTYNTGYGCLIAYDDGTYSTMYLSEKNAPAYVSSFEYTSPEDMYYG